MTVRISVLLVAFVVIVAQAQTSLPPDIHPVTLSRLPPPTPQDLDEEGQKLLAARPDFKPGPGPTHVTIYSPRERSLGVPSGEKSPVGARFFQLAVLIMAPRTPTIWNGIFLMRMMLSIGLSSPKRL